MKNGIVNSVKK